MTQVVHKIAREGFEAQVDVYDAARPSYPAAAIADIKKLFSLPSGAKVIHSQYFICLILLFY
jgi:hypothetical protein